MDVIVNDVPERRRFEARIDDKLAGYAEYTLDEGRIVFIHTQVDDAFEGQGVGGALARNALDNVRERGLAVVPRCAFIRGWIQRHPDYEDLVA